MMVDHEQVNVRLGDILIYIKADLDPRSFRCAKLILLILTATAKH